MRTHWMIAMTVALCTLIACDEHHHEGAHVHGYATLALALENDGVLSGEFRASGADVYGFEHEPHDGAELATHGSAREKLQDVETWISAGGAGPCAYETTEPVDDYHGGHGEVVFAFEMKCPELEPGGELDVNIQSLFPGLETVQVVIVGEAGQRSVKLEDGARRVRL